ncbi:winged helix-turn-helix transcriptional regulator [Desulfurococcaceae archaeon MEX13E-LK6-19]|nr:winged helix-turn-helix transcriptional regulator [Desulfurococcaceae archaeon MEX13E-LK6-19]
MREINSMILYIVLFLVAISTMITDTGVAEAQSINSITITIKDTGVVVVEIKGNAVVGINEYKAPVEPVLVSLRAYINNTQVATMYMNRTIYIPSTIDGIVYIRYIANVTTVQGVASFQVYDVGISIKLVVEPNVVLLTMPSNIESVKTVDGVVEITFSGSAVIKYVVTTVDTIKEGESYPATSTETPIGPSLPFDNNLLIVLIAAVTIVVLGIIALKYKRKLVESRSSYVSSILDNIDRSILQCLKESGGSLYQSELQRKLNLPKATLWRHVYKLAQLGFLEIVKEGRINKLVLKKKP